jgi:plastocyanin
LIARRTGAALAVGAAALVAVPVASSGATHVAATKPKPRTVMVQDNPIYRLNPGKLTVKSGTKVTWKWDSSNFDTHDVKLQKGPKGVKKFHSKLASQDYKFAQTLRKRGKYTVVCTLHPIDMHQTITVK